MKARKKILAKLLRLLEKRLQQTGHWQVALPAPEAFTSALPFCADTMTLAQWLRYLFIPRLQALVESEAPLPEACAISAQVEMQLPGECQAQVIEVTQAIDNLLTQGKTPPASLLRLDSLSSNPLSSKPIAIKGTP